MTPPKNLSGSSSDSRNVANSEDMHSKNGGHGPAARTLDLSRKMKVAESNVTGENVEPVGIEKRTGGGRHEKTPQQVINAIRKMWGIGATYSQICDMLSVTDPIVAKYTKGLEQGFSVKQEPQSGVVNDPNSTGAKSLDGVPTASITSVTQTQPGDGKKPETTKQLRFEDTLPALGRPPFTDNGEADGYSTGVDDTGRKKIDPTEQARWNRLMMFLYSEAFRGGWDSVEDYVSKEVFPQVRFAKAVQDIVRPLVVKRDAKGRPDGHEMFETAMTVIEEGMEKITLRLKTRKELEDKMMKEHNGGD